MIFDGHAHFGKKVFFGGMHPIFRVPLSDVNLLENRWEKYERLAEKKRIFKALALPYPVPGLNIETANEYVSETYRRNRELIIPFWLISNDISEAVLKKEGIRGFKEHFGLGKYQEKSYFAPAYDLLVQNDLFLSIHPHMSERVEKIHYLKRNFPKLKIILAHSGRKWPFGGDEVLEKIIPELKKYDGLYFDTSTIRDSSVIAGMVQALGSERILFGSDYPYCKDRDEDVYDLESKTVLQAKISDNDRGNILWRNFKRLFLKDTWVRKAAQDDKEEFFSVLSSVDAQERKHLALDQKMTVIRQNIKQERHIYLIEDHSQILGFLRESGRSNNGAVIEEIFVKKEARGNGYARLLLETAAAKFRYLEAKTFKENRPIASLFKTFGFQVEKASAKGSILYWKRKNVEA